MSQKKARPNRLAGEQSPYLLQHAFNPVDWYPWGDEAFDKARREDKPVFLSIGYSTCHWCHVMEKESFEDREVARLMNDTFVSVKVDREERLDVDAFYMTVCQMMTGRGGWPLTVVMSPEKRPFLAATYLPKTTRFNQIGMLDLIPRIKHLWHSRRQELLDSAGKIIEAVIRSERREEGSLSGRETLDAAYAELAAGFDPAYGGFSREPKFPTPTVLSFLLRYGWSHRIPKALEMVDITLENMSRGGIFDHLGGGFHRYSTDNRWLVPHFEKMLYDQALLTLAYTEAFQVTKNPAYRRTVEETLGYVLRDMTSPEGAFYSAEDADSEGVEGRFYVWTRDELDLILGRSDAALAAEVFNIRPEGNFLGETERKKTGANILHLGQVSPPPADSGGSVDPSVEPRLSDIRQKLFETREKRTRPFKDDKILTDWNGLMIMALSKAASVFRVPQWLRAASRASGFLLDKMSDSEGGLLHRYRGGNAEIPAFADDYAFLIWGLIELYQAGGDIEHLHGAVRLNRKFIDGFWDRTGGGFFLNSMRSEQLFQRLKPLYDGALPSPNAVALSNLLKLNRMTGDADLEAKAETMIGTFSTSVTAHSSAHTFFLSGLDFGLGPSREVVIAGPSDNPDTQAMLDAVRTRFLPRSVLLFRPSDALTSLHTSVAPFLSSLKAVSGQASAYVCEQRTCRKPITDIEKFLEFLELKP